LARLLNAASKFGLFSVSGLKDEMLTKRQTYMKTETCALYSGVFWAFKPNFIKLDPYNFELYRFKVGAFLGHSVCVVLSNSKSSQSDDQCGLLKEAMRWILRRVICISRAWTHCRPSSQTLHCRRHTARCRLVIQKSV